MIDDCYDIRKNRYKDQYDRDLATTIYMARCKNHLTQVQLAARLKVLPAYVSKIELGHATPSHKQLKRIAEVLGMDIEAPKLLWRIKATEDNLPTH